MDIFLKLFVTNFAIIVFVALADEHLFDDFIERSGTKFKPLDIILNGWVDLTVISIPLAVFYALTLMWRL